MTNNLKVLHSIVFVSDAVFKMNNTSMNKQPLITESFLSEGHSA